jgi:hypothetical protein
MPHRQILRSGFIVGRSFLVSSDSTRTYVPSSLRIPLVDFFPVHDPLAVGTVERLAKTSFARVMHLVHDDREGRAARYWPLGIETKFKENQLPR